MVKGVYKYMGSNSMINIIKYKFLMWFYKGNTKKSIDVILKYDPLKLLR